MFKKPKKAAAEPKPAEAAAATTTAATEPTKTETAEAAAPAGENSFPFHTYAIFPILPSRHGSRESPYGCKRRADHYTT